MNQTMSFKDNFFCYTLPTVSFDVRRVTWLALTDPHRSIKVSFTSGQDVLVLLWSLEGPSGQSRVKGFRQQGNRQ